MSGSFGGLIPSASGIDTAAIISSLMEAKARPIVAIEDRIADAEEEKRAFLDVNARLLSLQEISRRLYEGTSFNASVVRSSNENALLATGDTTAFEGTFQFFTHSLASSAQYISKGFSNTNSEKVSSTPGTFTIELGNARIQRTTELNQLNGATGIDRGKIRITDDAGRIGLVDLTNVITLDDVVEAINSNGSAQVSARINDDAGSGVLGGGLIIENASGAGNITVENVGTGATAASLGIAGTSGTGSIIGTRLNTAGRETTLSSLRNGRGLGDGISSPGSLVLTGSGPVMNIDLNSAKTIGDVIDAINAAGGTITASLGPDSTSLMLSDAGLPASINAVADPAVLEALGLESGPMLDLGGGDFLGRKLVSSLNSPLMSSLAGVNGSNFSGSVATPAQFDITDSAGATTTVSFTGREDLYEILDQINNPVAGANVLARFDETGTGIEILDQAGGGGSLTIADTTGTMADELGLAGVHADNFAEAGNLNFKHFHGHRQLSDFGFDSSIVDGSIEVTHKDGTQQVFDITAAQTIGDVMNALNSTPSLDVTLNDTGDGLLFTDNTGGTSPLVFRDVSGSIARKLNFSGTFTGAATVDRAYEFQVDVDADDTLADIQDKIKGLDVPIVATIVDDGSGDTRYRLSITGNEPGKKNDIVIRSSLDAFQFNQTSEASDAVLLYGNSQGSADPIVLRSENNTFKNVLSGVTLDLLGLSNQAITVSVTRDLQASFNDVSELADAFNSLADRLDEVAGFNVETLVGGPLMGDGTLSGLESSIVAALINAVEGLPLGNNTLSSIGIDIDSQGRLEVDAELLLESLENRLDEVEAIFNNTAELTPDTLFSNWNNGDGLVQDAGNDLRISFRDGSADLLLDVSPFDRLGQLIDALNADGRLLVEISADGRNLIFHDLTSGANNFSIADENDSGTSASLRLKNSTAPNGADRIETRNILLNTQLGVARRLDEILTDYTLNDGIIENATEAIDDRISALNEDIQKKQERLQLEQERLERQFAAMEAALSESEAVSNQLTQTLSSLSNNNKNKDK